MRLSEKKRYRMIGLVIVVTAMLITIFMLQSNRKTRLARESDKNGRIESVEPNKVGIKNDDPYQYTSEYIPMPIDPIKSKESTVTLQQLKMTDANTDNMVDNLYKEYSADLSKGIKSCNPKFDGEGRVSFSRISDDEDGDNQRYQLLLDYIGGGGHDSLVGLSRLPENRFHSLECATFQKESGVEIATVSMVLYSNVSVHLLISKDFSQVQSISESDMYQELFKGIDSTDASSFDGNDITSLYHYQQRIFQRATFHTREEQFVYYTYFKKDELEYILQYASNYTVLEGHKEYAHIGDLQSQEVCRETLLKLLEMLLSPD